MLKFTNLTLRRGHRILFGEANLTIHPGHRVGLTGANGCGKSSLFALIRGELHADSGDFNMPPNWVIAHVAQETPAVERSAIDYAIDGDSELRNTEAALREAEAQDDGHRQAELHAHLEAINGYTARSRGARLLHGLGFAEADIDKPVSTFSGGWRMRLNLAQALMCRSDLLLLDEPTNHLDLDAILWLEEWLRAYPGTLMLISHDRDFLDRVVNQIVHIEQEVLTLYTGNYSDFERIRAERLALQQSSYERQQREVRHMQAFVDRFRAKASKARQAQSRIKALERLELIAPAHVDSPFSFHFRQPERLPNPLLKLEHAAAGYADKVIIDKIEMTLIPGSRIGLLGHNGAGKSTLIRMLAGEQPPLAGVLEPARDLKIGYFAQHQLEQLRPDDSPYTHLLRLDPRASEQSLRDHLGGFGFNGDMALAPVGPFSGGEKARLVLALLVYQRPNLLLLDEPTNHLDLEMRHALTIALQEFEGAMLVVSHDRHLLRTVADDLWLVADGRARHFEGDLDDYRQWLKTQEVEEPESTDSEMPQTNSATARKEQRRLDAEQRKRLQPLRKRLQQVEKIIDKTNTEKAGVETALGDNSLYEESSRERLKGLLQQQAELEQALASAEEEWLSISEQLEAAE